jgi:hypothetical protein
MFADIRYISIHLEISATVGAIAPEELPIRIRTTSFGGCGIGQGSVAKTEEAEGCQAVGELMGGWGRSL